MRASCGKNITLPLGAIVIVPATAQNVNDYVEHQRTLLAPRLLSALSVRNPARYKSLVTSALINDSVRKIVGTDADFQLPNPSLRHSRPCSACPACKASFMSAPGATAEGYRQHHADLAAAIEEYRAPLTTEAIADIQDACNHIPR